MAKRSSSRAAVTRSESPARSLPAFTIVDHRLCADGSAVPFRPTPNLSGVIEPRYLIMHFTAGASAASSVEWLCKPEARASAHLVIGRDGSITQLASFNRATWHAGASRWGDIEGLNSHSIGIELDNAGKLTRDASGAWKSSFGRSYPASDVIEARHKNEDSTAGWHAYSETQLAVAEAISAVITRHYGLADVLGHDDIAPGRKNDPGPAFPMDAFRGRVLGRDDTPETPFFATEWLNLRAAPSASAAKVIENGLPAGTRVLPTGQVSGAWWMVQVADVIEGDPDLEGWVHSRFLSQSVPRRLVSRDAHGYTPPPASAAVLAGVPFATAKAVGAAYRQIYAAADAGSQDPSLCRAILSFPDGTLFYDSKMAIDADGSPRATAIDPTGQLETSLRYQSPGNHKGESLNSEKVPYFVLPLPDKHGSNDFCEDFGIQLGDIALIVYKGGMTGAIFADKGPHRKIGEASIRVHELLPVPSPWKNPLTKDKLRNASVESGVLTFVFPGTSGILASLTPANAESLITEVALDQFARLKS